MSLNRMLMDFLPRIAPSALSPVDCSSLVPSSVTETLIPAHVIPKHEPRLSQVKKVTSRGCIFFFKVISLKETLHCLLSARYP